MDKAEHVVQVVDEVVRDALRRQRRLQRSPPLRAGCLLGGSCARRLQRRLFAALGAVEHIHLDARQPGLALQALSSQQLLDVGAARGAGLRHLLHLAGCSHQRLHAANAPLHPGVPALQAAVGVVSQALAGQSLGRRLAALLARLLCRAQPARSLQHSVRWGAGA